MSVVVAVHINDRIVILSDTRTTCGDETWRDDNIVTSKIIRTKNSFIGFSGWHIYSHILEHLVQDVDNAFGMPRNEQDVFYYFLEVWKLLHQKDYIFVKDQTDDEGPFGSFDTSFIFINPTGIYSVATDCSILKYNNYYSLGSGRQYAMGAINVAYKMQSVGMGILGSNEPENKASSVGIVGVEAALDFNVYCGGNIEGYEISTRRLDSGGYPIYRIEKNNGIVSKATIGLICEDMEESVI